MAGQTVRKNRGIFFSLRRDCFEIKGQTPRNILIIPAKPQTSINSPHRSGRFDFPLEKPFFRLKMVGTGERKRAFPQQIRARGNYDDEPQVQAQGICNVTALTIDWENLLQANQAWLRTVIAARGARSADEVDEIFQNVALAAIHQNAPIRNSAKVLPWLYTLAVNQTALFCRGKGRYQKRVDGFRREHADGGVSSEPEPLEWLLRRERWQLVNEAMDRLPPEVREILLLKYVHNQSYKEMAEKLGEIPSTIQARLHHARAALKKEIRL